MKINAATALILHIMMIQGQVLQNLIFHMSLQEIQQEILNFSSRRITSLLKVPNHSTAMEKEVQEDRVFGIEISSTAPELSEPLWNLYLECGCIHDLIQTYFGIPSFLHVSQPTNSSLAWVSFHHTIRSHVSPLLLSSTFLSFSLCCIPFPHAGSLDPRFLE